MTTSDAFGATILESRREAIESTETFQHSARPQFQFGKRAARFSEESAALLRDRLTLATLVLSITSTLMFLSNWLFGDAPAPGLRVLLIVVIVGSYLLLRSKRLLTLKHLLLIEFAVFGGILGQLFVVATIRMLSFANADDVVSIAASRHVFEMAVCVVILTYGMFVPNTWQRAAAILIPVALVPEFLPYYLAKTHPAITIALSTDHVRSPFPFPLLAALIVSIGAHSINRIRRAAFDARRLGQYILKDRIGKGGMGEVYRAEHTLLKRPCAVKLIRPECEADARALARFELEVRATARLSHWNTVEIYDYGHTDDGTFYYVMELLPGMSLEELVRRDGPLPSARAIHFLKQVCSALREAHGIGLIHRDIKPANIYATERGGVHDVAKLLDFGLVKQTDTTADTSAEVKGISGSPLYMPPEQANDPAAIDARSDIYAVGGVAYFLVTGEPPFVGTTLMELIAAHANKPVTPPNVLAPDLPTDVNDLILRCLAKSQADRYQTVSELLEALQSCDCAHDWTERQATTCWRLNKRAATQQVRLCLTTVVNCCRRMFA